MILLTPFTYLLQAGLGLFKNNKLATVAIIVALVLGLSQFRQCSKNQILKKKLAVAEHNLAAASDTIRSTKDNNDKDEFNKLAFLTDKLSNLEKLNTDLAVEVKAIKGKVATIITGEVKIIHDTIPLVVKGELIDSTLTTTFDYSKFYSPGNSRVFKGYTKYNLRNGQTGGEVTVDELSMRFSTGIKGLDKGKPEIFLKSDYPGFTVTALDGAVIDPKLFKVKKTPLITTGINIGWTPMTYNLGTKKLNVNLQQLGVTAGLSINIFKLLKPNK